ncbi:MAG: nuclear transport factor 2 family protein [Candidatus Promineifilaceae bacterium]
MDAHRKLVEDFYTAFQAKDYVGMNGCYHPEIHFRDPVFQDLYGSEAKAMWHMLCERGKDLVIAFQNVQAGERGGSVRWDAHYTFSTGRKVHNIVRASFEFQDGKIIHHEDVFDLWRWTRHALGPVGVLLGWSPIVKNKVRRTARQGLELFLEKHPDYQR